MTTHRARPSLTVLLVGGLLVSTAALLPSLPSPAQSAPTADEAPFDDSNVLVGFRPGTSRASQDEALARVQGHRQRAIGGVVLATVPPGQVKGAVGRLRQESAVRYAEPDWIGHVAATPNDPSFGQQWSLANTGQTVNGITGTAGEDIGARQAWDVTGGSASVVVGVVDTGADYTHPDLAANIWDNPGGVNGCAAGTHGYNALTGTCDPKDDDTAYGGHGSHVAGIISAVGNNGTGVTGVGWRTTVLPVKTVDSSGNGTTSDLLTGLDWLLRAKQAGVNVKVVNDSQTWKGTAYSQALRDEIELLGSNGILFVSAGGNTSEDNDNPSLRRWPCGYVTSTSLCAAATTSTGGLASYANRGATTVDLGAPGDNIYSTLRGGGYGYVSGSSMAAAEVSGAAALLLAQQDRTPLALKQALLMGAEAKSGLAGKVRTGARLDVCGAMPGCGSAPPPGTTTATAGTTTVGGLTDTMSADRKRVNRVTLPVDGQVTKLSMYLAPTGTGSPRSARRARARRSATRWTSCSRP
jgi:subtilisin family serine protease